MAAGAELVALFNLSSRETARVKFKGRVSKYLLNVFSISTLFNKVTPFDVMLSILFYVVALPVPSRMYLIHVSSGIDLICWSLQVGFIVYNFVE